MSRHLDKVLAHAERELAPASGARPSEVLPLYKKFLRVEEHRLRLKHQAGAGGRDICGGRSRVVDLLLQHVFAASDVFARSDGGPAPTPLTLLALGGYGRGELNPFSDVDVMFLHDGVDGVSPYAEEVVKQVLYLLWDIGIKVGHSTRSVSEAVEQANSEMLTKTAMLEARFVAGDQDVGRAFRNEFREKCVQGHEREYVELRMQDQAARHAKYGNSVYLQEPHVKSGCGGLRDYQNLLWMTFFGEGSLTTTHLVGKDWLSAAHQRRIDMAYDFLLRLRTELHYVNGRVTDLLLLNFQEQIAQRLGYPRKGRAPLSEALMKDYYEHTRNIFRVTERITEQFASGRSSNGTRPFFAFVPETRGEEEDLGDFVIRDGRLYAKESDVLKRDPIAMMQVFEAAQVHGIDLSPELEDLFARHPGVVTRTFGYAIAPRQIFLRILSRKGQAGAALRMMHRVDFLGRYIPEFGSLTCLVQHEFFHRYTADEHTLVCIEKVDELTSTTNPKLVPYRELFERMEDPLVLYLALLLHDTGKGVGARPHSEASALFAQRVASRLQLSREQRRSLIFLVDHHLTMSNMAQQRNVADPETIVEFAALVRTQKNLDALMLLTLADGQGTSADNWSDWKESLVWHLYHVTSQYLTDQSAFFEQRKREREWLQSAVAARFSADYAEEIEAHFEYMPDTYFHAFGVKEIASHAALFRRFLTKLFQHDAEVLTCASHWEAFPEQGHSTVSFCTWDGQHLLAKLAGSLSVVPLNILSADIYTRGDNVVLDVFRVSDPQGRAVTDERDFALVEKTLRTALDEPDFDFRPQLETARQRIRHQKAGEVEFPTRIDCDNRAHPTYTLIQIETPDRLGLLSDLLFALGEEGISIASSRISTEKGAAIDTFYVVDGATRTKITESTRIEALQKRLQTAALGS